MLRLEDEFRQEYFVFPFIDLVRFNSSAGKVLI